MTPEPQFDEMQLVREFRQHLAEIPPGLQARLEERLWQDVLKEEARVRGGGTHRTRAGWLERLGWSGAFRQASIAGAAAMIVVAFALVNGSGTNQQPATGTGSDPIEAGATDPLSRLVRKVGGSAGESNTPTTNEQLTRSPLVAGTAVVIFETGDEVPLSRIAQGPGALSPRELSLLPANESQLLALLRAAGSTVPASGHGEDFVPFQLAAIYLAAPQVPLATRVALMRMLRTMDDLSVGGSVADLFGRRGVMIARDDDESGLRQQFLLDERTGQMLEHRDVVATDQGESCPAGTVVKMSAYDGITGMRVTPESAPTGDWPELVPACA